MHQGKLVSSQLMAHLLMSTFRRCVAKHRGHHKVKDFSCLDQFFAMARALYAKDPLGIDLDAGVYALDASTIDLCVSLHPWAPFRSTKAAVKLHTLLDLNGRIPSFIHITDGKTHELNVLDNLVIEAAAFYLMDRGYLDLRRLYVIHRAQALFVTPAKSNTQFRRRYCNRVDRRAPPRSSAIRPAYSRFTTPARTMRLPCAGSWSRTKPASASRF